MGSLSIGRTARLPDPLRVARSLRAPELGPRILFFSGGSALKGVSRQLKRYTHNSVHLITPFDSGGSSAVLRDAFAMLSVGDLRNRIMALADESALGNPAIYRLFSHRLPREDAPDLLVDRVWRMVHGEDPLVASVPAPIRRIVRTHLRMFAERMPHDFDLRGASIGNLLLAGGYLTNERDMASVVYLFSKVVQAQGLVLPIVETELHLEVTLTNGRSVVQQHRFTGKEEPTIEAPIDRLRLVTVDEPHYPAEAQIDDKVRHLIETADVIVYPMGSFYSSVLAALLPRGVGRAIVEARCPKVYLPNAGDDPEQTGMTLPDAIARITAAVRADAGEEAPIERILDGVLVDSEAARYGTPLCLDQVRAMGVGVGDLTLTEQRPDRFDPARVAEALISLA